VTAGCGLVPLLLQFVVPEGRDEEHPGKQGCHDMFLMFDGLAVDVGQQSVR
jgi:hypothetical protein